MTICQAAGDTTLLTFTLVHLARAEWLAGDLSAAEHVRQSVRLQSVAPIPASSPMRWSCWPGSPPTRADPQLCGGPRSCSAPRTGSGVTPALSG